MLYMPWVKLCGPNDEEVVGAILLPKILGNAELVENFVSEVDICSFDPWDLRLQSKVKSGDLYWYFFSPRGKKYANRKQQSRKTPSGFWKLTGDPVSIMDTRKYYCETQGGEIGYKRVLVFQTNFTTPSCQKSRLEYKGNDINILSYVPTVISPTFVIDMTHGASASVADQIEYNSVSQGQQFGGNFVMDHLVEGNSAPFNNFPEYDLANQAQLFSGGFNTQLQAPYSALYNGEEEPQMIWNDDIPKDYEFLGDQMTYTQGNCSNHRPRNPVTGVLPGYSSDSDTGSTACRDTSSSKNDTVVGSSSGPYHKPIDEVTSLTTIEPQEQPKQLELQVPGREKMIYTRRMAEDSVKKAPSTRSAKQMSIVFDEMIKNCLVNMLVKFILFTERPFRDYSPKKK